MNTRLIVHLLQIPPEGLALEGELPPEILALESDTLRASHPICYRLDVGLRGHSFFATGTVEADLEFECGSCLGWFPLHVEVPNFAVQEETAGPEAIDLTPQLREDILLALPAYPRCETVGLGPCPGTPSAPPDGEPEAPDPGGSTAWAALDQLLTKPDHGSPKA